MRPEDYRAFVRPMYLIAVLSNHHMLIAVPPNRRVVERARNFRMNLSHAISLEGYTFAGFAAYPDDETLPTLYHSPSFQPFVKIVYRGRLRKLEAARRAEDERDSVDMVARLERDAIEREPLALEAR